MTGNKWHKLLSFSLQDEPLFLHYSRISLTHCPLSLTMHGSSSFCIQHWNTSWILDQTTHEDEDLCYLQSTEESPHGLTTSKKRKIKKKSHLLQLTASAFADMA